MSIHEAPTFYSCRIISDHSILPYDHEFWLPSDGFFIQYRLRHPITSIDVQTVVPRDELLSVNIYNMLTCFNIPTSMYEEIYSAAISFTHRRSGIVPILVDIFAIYPNGDTDTDDDDDDVGAHLLRLSLDEGVRCVPATNYSIEALEKTKGSDSMGEKCAICMDDFSMDSEVGRMPCSHVYHHECIVEWLERSHVCPLCRFKLPVDPS